MNTCGQVKEILLSAYRRIWSPIAVVIALLLAFAIVKCSAQSVYVGAQPFVPMLDGSTDVKINVGIDYAFGCHYLVGAEMTYTPSSRTKCGLSVYNAVGSYTDRWSFWVKGKVGAEHIFTDEQTDHSYITYGVGLRVTRQLKHLGVYVEPSLNWSTYSAYISPSAERGWYGIGAGVSIPIK